MFQQSRLSLFKFVAFATLAAATAGAQSSSSSTTGQTPPSSSSADGTEYGGYNVQQTVELGYRFSRLHGSPQVYDTFIDQHEGLRLIDQSLTMRSMQHTGSFFDDLTMSNFGFGGDPENVSRLRVSKYHVYDFTGLFRRDQNTFDYNLLANPLNPPTSAVVVPVNDSPHAMFIRRRMYDFGLTLFPDSRFTMRLGYSRNRSEGPSFSSFHEGTDVLLNQAWNVTSNEFRIGFDVKVLPTTTISYDQFLAYDRNDTDYTLAPFATYTLPGGTPVELGLPWNTQGGSPCAVPFKSGFVNPGCNGYFQYNRFQRVRTSSPTEQLTLKSNMNRVNLVGRVSYSVEDLHSPYSEFFNGLVTRTSERQFTFSGPASARRIATTADFDATVALTHSIQLVESFRFDRWNIPGAWDSLGTATTAATTPPTLLSPLGVTTVTPDFVVNFLGQKGYYNTLQFEVTPSKHFGFHVGYRFRHRHVFKAEPEHIDPEAPFEAFEGDAIDINEQSGIGGIWFRPTNALRINADAEVMTADNFLTRVSPRQRQNYRARIDYRPKHWANLALSANDSEGRNSESDTRARQRYRNAGMVLTLTPGERVNFDLSYNYTNVTQNAFICYNGAFVVPGTVVNGCPTFDPTATADNPNPNWIYSTYSEKIHFVSGAIMLRPVKKITANIGYGLTNANGLTTLLNPLAPLGPQEFTYHQPLASLSFEVAPKVSLNGYWNYDEYNEFGAVGPTLPRYFRDNRTVVSVKYAF